MGINAEMNNRIDSLIGAFDRDGFDVDREIGRGVFIYNDRIGIRAVSRNAKIGTTGKMKKSYYTEGSPYEMGYLMGIMAEPDVNQMCTTFIENIVFDFIHVEIKSKPLHWVISRILLNILHSLSSKMFDDIPKEYTEELNGMAQGCYDANHETKVDIDRLQILNAGVDAILAFVYTGKLPVFRRYPVPIKEKYFRVPIMCNGFSVFGGAPSDQNRWHLLGRHFMFPTAGVFEHAACCIIQVPEFGIPFVQVTAPGMIGSVAAMNRHGVGVGVDMGPAGNCNHKRPGFNSLLLARYSVEKGDSGENSLQVMEDAQRGVSWIYILGDGKKQKACIVESGSRDESLDVLSYPPKRLVKEGLLPDREYIAQHPSAEMRKGLMARWNNFQYPQDYQQRNPALFKDYKNRHLDFKYIYNPVDFSKMGFLDKKWEDRNCPHNKYFPPERETAANMVLTTNHFIIPEMKICTMYPWTNTISAAFVDESQWRYDELNEELVAAIQKGGGAVDYNTAKSILSFLDPAGEFPAFYNPKNEPLDQLAIHGSLSLMDLVNLKIESHYGFWKDEWITINLKNYFDL